MEKDERDQMIYKKHTYEDFDNFKDLSLLEIAEKVVRGCHRSKEYAGSFPGFDSEMRKASREASAKIVYNAFTHNAPELARMSKSAADSTGKDSVDWEHSMNLWENIVNWLKENSLEDEN